MQESHYKEAFLHSPGFVAPCTLIVITQLVFCYSVKCIVLQDMNYLYFIVLYITGVQLLTRFTG